MLAATVSQRASLTVTARKGSYRVIVVLSSGAGTRRPVPSTSAFDRHPRVSACRLGVLAFGDSITNGGGELQWGVALQSWALWIARGLGLPYTGYAVDGARAADVVARAAARRSARARRRRTRATTSAACTSASTTSARSDFDAAAFARDHARRAGVPARALRPRAERHAPAGPRPPARRARRRGQRDRRSPRAQPARWCSTCATSARATW